MKNKQVLKLLKKHFKVRRKSFCKNENLYKNYVLVSKSYSLITLRQIESLRKFITRRLAKKRKKTKFVIARYNSFKKGSKSRMGKGKGNFYKFYGHVKPGMVLFEFSEYSPSLVVFGKFNSIYSKLPFKCFLYRQDIFFNLYRC